MLVQWLSWKFPKLLTIETWRSHGCLRRPSILALVTLGVGYLHMVASFCPIRDFLLTLVTLLGRRMITGVARKVTFCGEVTNALPGRWNLSGWPRISSILNSLFKLIPFTAEYWFVVIMLQYLFGWNFRYFPMKTWHLDTVQTLGGNHCTTLHYTTLYWTTLHYTTLHCTALHYTTLHYTVLHFITLHYTTLHCTALHYTTLHCTTLH